ncbi:MAG TPA: tetratricopeptide repeat protein [Candidatus Acidoferrum sp.]|nr:tetratricopeptide repeat protein [Candidatus Acidoferrum sp.]
MEARKSSDLGAIERASERVIALGLVELARIRLDHKAYNEATTLCRNSLDFEDTPETRLELAIASLYAQKPADAVEQASLVAEREPQNALAWNIKGQALLQTKDYAGAATSLGKSFELQQDTEPLYALGIAYLAQGEKQKAADTFSQLLALTGDHGWSRVLLGRAYQKQRLPHEAETEFQKALQLDPRTTSAHYFWAMTLLEANQWSPTPDVREHLLEELKLNPRDFLTNYWLGYFASKERNYDESDRYLRLAVELNPSQPETWLYLGLNAQHHADTHSAEAYFRKAIALTKNLDPKEHLAIRRAYFALGRILMSSARKKEGEEVMRQAQELELVVWAQSQKNVGDTKAERGTGVSEAATADIPETENQNNFSARPGPGLIGGEDPRVTARPTAKSPHEPSANTEAHLYALLGASLNDLATAEALEEKYQLALKHYREAAGWDPRIPGLERNLGLAAFYVGEHAEAIRLLAKVVRVTPSDAYARAVLGLAYFATQDFGKAVQTIAPIANLAQQDPQLGLAWAKSLAATGNKKEAERVLRELDKKASVKERTVSN